jgi:ribosomal protection tetracycline resistance protein
MRTLNLGILAHVDAGKTTLTERLLFAAGVIDEIGSVDDGSTQTDTLALERQRGITIRSAVVSFVLGDVTVDLIDTPGHPDFIAEVERVLGVLDGVVLVLSAVEGVQAQTLVLMRTLQRLRIPTLLFVNKIDRRGADVGRVLRSISDRLTPSIVAMVAAHDVGRREAGLTPLGPDDAGFVADLAEVIAEHDDAVLASYVDDEAAVSYDRLREGLVRLTARALVYPVFIGSAMTGAGVETLMAGIPELLPAGEGDVDRATSGTVFKIERGPAGEKVAYVRMFQGSIGIRDRVRSSSGLEHKVTAIEVFDGSAASSSDVVHAGQIAKLWGLSEIRVGEAVGATASAAPPMAAFDPPALEAVVVPRDPNEGGELRAALMQLGDQDPLINVRQRAGTAGLYVSLYGEVQKEVLHATLADGYGIDVAFRGTRVICIERPAGVGAAVIRIGDEGNHRLATVGLRVEPSEDESGVRFDLDVGLDSVPLYIFGTVEAFGDAIERAVRGSLSEGPHGWRVTDCLVTMTDADFRSPSTRAGDYRHLTGVVLKHALERAGTTVCEPIHTFRIEIPVDTLASVWQTLARLQAVPDPPTTTEAACVLEGLIPAARLPELRRHLAGLTHGEGALSSSFVRYRPS